MWILFHIWITISNEMMGPPIQNIHYAYTHWFQFKNEHGTCQALPFYNTNFKEKQISTNLFKIEDHGEWDHL